MLGRDELNEKADPWYTLLKLVDGGHHLVFGTGAFSVDALYRALSSVRFITSSGCQSVSSRTLNGHEHDEKHTFSPIGESPTKYVFSLPSGARP